MKPIIEMFVLITMVFMSVGAGIGVCWAMSAYLMPDSDGKRWFIGILSLIVGFALCWVSAILFIGWKENRT